MKSSFCILAAIAAATLAASAHAQTGDAISVKPWRPPAAGEQPHWIGAIVIDVNGRTVGRVSRIQRTGVTFLDVEISNRGERYWVDRQTLTLDERNYVHSTQTYRAIRWQLNHRGGLPNN